MLILSFKAAMQYRQVREKKQVDAARVKTAVAGIKKAA